MPHQILPRSRLADAAGLENGDVFAEGQCFRGAMRHDQRRARQLREQPSQLAADGAARLYVQRRQRLVQQQQAWFEHDGARDRDALLLAAGEFMRAPPREGRDAEPLERRGHTRACALRGGPLHAQAERDVLGGRQVWEQRVVLRHIAHLAFARAQAPRRAAVEPDLAVDLDVAAVGIDQPREQLQERRLSRAALADKNHRGPVADVEPGLEREPAELLTYLECEHLRDSTSSRRERTAGPAAGRRP